MHCKLHNSAHYFHGSSCRSFCLPSIMQVQAAAHTTFNSIVERQVLVEKARQESQVAARFKSVLGFSGRLQAHCTSRQYGLILPAYQQASTLIQAQADAVSHSTVDWSVLQRLMDEVTCPHLPVPDPETRLKSAMGRAVRLVCHPCFC